jgi:DNA-directed RNA polymerase subunit K/omega
MSSTFRSSSVGESCLTRFECAKIVGLRALQIAEGAELAVPVDDADLARDCVYVASLELYEGKLDVIFLRQNGVVHAADLNVPGEVGLFLNARDGGDRPTWGSRA